MSFSRTISYMMHLGEEVLRGEHIREGGQVVSVSESVPASDSATLAVEIDVSALKMLFLIVDGDEDGLTITFNGPDLEITVVPGGVFAWASSTDLANPFGSTDVTSISLVNEGDNATTLRMELLTDPTP